MEAHFEVDCVLRARCLKSVMASPYSLITTWPFANPAHLTLYPTVTCTAQLHLHLAAIVTQQLSSLLHSLVSSLNVGKGYTGINMEEQAKEGEDWTRLMNALGMSQSDIEEFICGNLWRDFS